MKKFVLLLGICMLSFFVRAQWPQSYFSDWLSIDTSFTLALSRQEINQKHWVATVSQNKFYCSPRKAFQAHEKTYTCVLYAVDLTTCKQDTFTIEYPALGSLWKKEAQACYLYAMSFEEDRLLLVCDNQLLLYKFDNHKFKFEKRLFCMGVYTGYLYQQQIYALVHDKERAVFRWICYDQNREQESRLICELEQPAPFLLQFDPHRYLFVNEHSLYYLPPGDCVLYKYSLRGDLLDSVRFELPGQHAFPQEMLGQLQKLPYGTERIYHALNYQYRQYSFVKTIDPLSDSLLLLSVNLGDKCRQQQLAVMRLHKTANGWQQDFSTLAVNDTGQVYKPGMFPASFHLSADNMLLYPYRNHLLQLLFVPEKEEYLGRSAMQYRRYKDSWFKDHEPVVKFRLQRVHEICRFYDFDNHVITLNDLGHDKVILMLNQQPQCSACQKQLLIFLSQVDSSRVAVACQMGKVDSYLARRQQLQSMSELVPRYFHPLYDIDTENYTLLRKYDSYPVLLFWQKNVGIVGTYTTESIFTTNYDRYDFTEKFLNDFQSFISDERK